MFSGFVGVGQKQSFQLASLKMDAWTFTTSLNDEPKKIVSSSASQLFGYHSNLTTLLNMPDIMHSQNNTKYTNVCIMWLMTLPFTDDPLIGQC